MIADLYALPVGDQWLLYSPLRRFTARVNTEAVRVLRAERDPLAKLPDLEAALRVKPEGPPAPSQQLERTVIPEKIVIFPTHRCNLRCVYCDFCIRSQRQASLPPESAERFIDAVLDLCRAGDRASLTVHFFGGEPLIEEDFIRRVVAHIRSRSSQAGIDAHIEASTNGHLSPTMAEFAAANIDTLVVSCDGPGYQDLHRPGADGTPSMGAVSSTIRRLCGGSCKLCIRTCVTKASVERLPELTRWMCSNFRFETLDFEPLTENQYSRAAGLEPPDPFEFARAFMLARAEAIAYGVDTVNGLTLLNKTCWSSCPMGLDTLMLMPDGTITVCYLPPVQWQSIGFGSIAGEMTAAGGLQLIPERLLAARLLLHDKPRCERCFCRWTCAGGCHARQTPRGCSNEYNSTCLQTRLVTAALLLELTGADPLCGFLEQISYVQTLALHADDRVYGPTGQADY